MTPFVYNFSSLISETFDDIENILNRKMRQIVKFQGKLPEIVFSDETTLEIYRVLFQAGLFFSQGISMEDLMTETGKSRNTIQTRLKKIPKEHIIVNGTKKLFYRLNMKIFKNSLK